MNCPHCGKELDSMTVEDANTHMEACNAPVKDRYCVYDPTGNRICRGLDCRSMNPCAHGLQISQEHYDKLKAYQSHLIFNHLDILKTDEARSSGRIDLEKQTDDDQNKEPREKPDFVSQKTWDALPEQIEMMRATEKEIEEQGCICEPPNFGCPYCEMQMAKAETEMPEHEDYDGVV